MSLPPPALGHWREGNTGTEGVWRFESGSQGRDVLVTALVHGNELCGAWAVLAALEAGLRPRRGALTLAFCNLAAFDRFDVSKPDASRFVDQDLNRVWGDMAWRTTVAPRSIEQRRALELQPFVERADWLLDLHSMHEDGPPIALAGQRAQDRDLALALGAPGLILVDAGHRDGCRLRDHGRFGVADDMTTRALLLECGPHWGASSRTVALDMLARFLPASGCVDASDLRAGWLQAPAPVQQVLIVTEAVVAGAESRFAQAWCHGQRVPKAGTLLGSIDAQPFSTPYDDCVLVMPSLRQARAGVTVMRLARQAKRG